MARNKKLSCYSIDEQIRHNKNLKPSEKLIGMAFAQHFDRNAGVIRVKQEKIAQETGYSVRTVIRGLKRIVEEGILTAKRTPYFILLRPTMEVIDAGNPRKPWNFLDVKFSTEMEERYKQLVTWGASENKRSEDVEESYPF